MALATPTAAPTPAIPLHARITQVLRGRILDGTYPALARMPSESELGALFGASRITVRHALSQLQRDGLIFTLHGKGSFVAGPKAYQNVGRLMGFAESMATHGHQVLNELLSLQSVAADARVAERLQVTGGTSVTEIRRLRLLNAEPVSLEVTYVHEPLGQRLAQADLVGRDIFVIIENDYATPLGYADLAIDATVADEELARALRIETSAPVMRIERLTHDATGRPIDFEYLYFRADRFQYRLRINRGSAPQE
jgi:GntR family transcriptional regulator